LIAALNFLGRHAPRVMVLSVFIALAVQPLAALLRPALMPCVWALLVFSMVRLDRKAFLAVLAKPARVGLALVWMLAVTPVIMWGIVSMSTLDPAVAAALVLTAGSSPLMSTPAIGLILGLDVAFLLAVLVAATLLLPLTLPVVALSLLGLELETSAVELTLRLGALVGSAAVAAWAVRGIFGGARVEQYGKALDGGSVLLLLIFAVALFDGVTARLISEPARMALWIALSFAVYIGQLLLSAALFGLLWRDKMAAWSAAVSAGCRNLAVLIAALAGAADDDIITYFALAQFPIYIMPSIMKWGLARTLRPASAPPISEAGGS
jgi:BASS family bile acid:Na+ symporter